MRAPPLLAATALGCVVSSAPAAADYTTVAPVRPLTMSDPSGLSSIGIELQLTRWTERPVPGLEVDFSSVTFDVAADIRLAPHWVLIGRVPVSHVGIDGDPAAEGCCDVALGNLTVGGRGLWASVFDGGSRAVAGGELSLSVPTASDDGDGAVSAASGALARLPHDPGRYLPNTTTLRFTTLAQFYSRRFLVQGEAGLQLYLYDDDVAGDSSELGVRLALAAGVRATYKIAILAELNALFYESGRLGGDDSVTSIDIGLRYGSGSAIFGARVYFPIDSALRDLDMVGVGFDGGLRF